MRFFTCSLLAILFSFSVYAQRFLSTVLDPVEPQNQTAVLGDRVFIAAHGARFMRIYNDVDFSSFTYPTVSGVALRFDTYNNPLVPYSSSLYFSLCVCNNSKNG